MYSKNNIEINEKEYIEWLENMVILLGKCYQETHDMLREKAKKNETKVYFEIPIVQGTKLTFAIEDISKLNCNGNVPNSEVLKQYIERLKVNYN